MSDGQPVSALTELSSLSGDEAFYVVEDIDGTPVSRRVSTSTLANYFGGSTDVLSDVAGGYAYVGCAAAGSSTSASVWTITRIDLDDPNTPKHASSVAWTDRYTATYS